jgi:hypothetical protein
MVRQTGFHRRPIAKWIRAEVLPQRNASAPKATSTTSKTTCRTDGQKAGFAAGDCSKKSKRAAIPEVSQTSRGCWRNGAIQNASWRGLRRPLQRGRPRSGYGSVDFADCRRAASIRPLCNTAVCPHFAETYRRREKRSHRALEQRANRRTGGSYD